MEKQWTLEKIKKWVKKKLLPKCTLENPDHTANQGHILSKCKTMITLELDKRIRIRGELKYANKEIERLLNEGFTPSIFLVSKKDSHISIRVVLVRPEKI